MADGPGNTFVPEPAAGSVLKLANFRREIEKGSDTTSPAQENASCVRDQIPTLFSCVMQLLQAL